MPPKPAEVNVAYGDEAKNKPKCWFCRNRDHVYQYFRNLLSERRCTKGWLVKHGRESCSGKPPPGENQSDLRSTMKRSAGSSNGIRLENGVHIALPNTGALVGVMDIPAKAVILTHRLNK